MSPLALDHSQGKFSVGSKDEFHNEKLPFPGGLKGIKTRSISQNLCHFSPKGELRPQGGVYADTVT